MNQEETETRREGDTERRNNRVAESPRPRIEQICVACGTPAERENAKYCLICGKILSEDYQPLDSLRSSYNMQGKSFFVENKPSEQITDLFEINKNSVSEMAWASFVYSMVPFLGVLFIPVTLLIGSYGFGVAISKPDLGGRKLSLISIGLSFPVLGLQIFFWWLLYIIPELAGRV